MTNKSLYNIEQELVSIWAELEENGGDLTPELEEKLAITENDFRYKVENYCKLIKQTNYNVDAAKVEKKRLDDIIKSRTNKIDRLKERVLGAIQMFSPDGKRVEFETFKVYTSSSKSVLTHDTLIEYLKDKVLEFLYKAYDNYLLDIENIPNIDPNDVIEFTNASFKEDLPDMYESIMEEKGNVFTIDDLGLIKLDFTVQFNAQQLLNKSSFPIYVQMMNHQNNLSVEHSFDRDNYKIMKEFDKTTNLAEDVVKPYIVIK